MQFIRIVSLLLALCCLLPCSGVLAAEVESEATYCFTAQDFSSQEEPIVGICVTGLPGAQGAVLLGSRVVQPGDILTAEQIAQMTFAPVSTQEDAQAVLTYLPIYENRVEPAATMTISIRGKENLAPAAQDSSLETYKNIPNEGKLLVSDPEGELLTYTLVREPRRGTLELGADGTFTYTPKKNKVGVDSFTYTAADPAGNVSREATVTIQILKPTEKQQYTDTVGESCRFEAEWLRNTGLFVSETVSGESCFLPEKTVSRGEFLAMLVDLLEIPKTDAEAAAGDVPQWLQPYLAAAQRAGLTDRLQSQESFSPQQPITGAEAAVMLQNALDLSITQDTLETMAQEDTSWSASSITVLADNGILLTADQTLTRADAAQVLYRVSQLAPTAPGTVVFRMNQ